MKAKRRDFLRTMGAGVLAFAVPMASLSKDASPPNIVLCMADDQGWGDMAYNGHPVLKTPHFDAMAREAFRFDRFYAAAPVCSPTRGSVMTGRHPNRFGCFSWGRTLRPQEITLAEALRTAGYVTGHFGKWHLGSVESGSPVNPGASGFDEWFSAPNFFDNDPILSREGKAVPTQGESSMVTADVAIDFIRKQSKSDRPFFAVVWFGSPHLPHRALAKDREAYSDRSEALQNFYGEISAMDEAFGKLRREIKSLGIRDNTILWYCSDNGGLPNVGSAGGRGHKGQIYEGGLRVPALIEWPSRIPNSKQTGVPCCTSDIYPTLLDMVGVKLEKQPPLDGTSLTSLFDGAMKKRPKPIGFWHHAVGGISTPSKQWMAELLEAQKKGQTYSDLSRLRLDAADLSAQYPENDFPGHSAWLDWPWKLHRIQQKEGKVKWELYNLESDPNEKMDRVESDSTQAASMKEPFEKWLTSVVQSLNGKDY